MARRTAGQKFEPEPHENAEQEPQDFATKLAEAVEAAKSEKFPKDLKKATALLREVAATEVKSQADWRLLQPRLNALRLHVRDLQQGLPVLPSASTDHDHGHMQKVMREMQLKQLIRTNPLIKDLVTENEALKKAKAPDELNKQIETLKAALADSNAKLAEAQAKIVELTKSPEK